MRVVTVFRRNPHARIRVPPVVAYLSTVLTGRRQPALLRSRRRIRCNRRHSASACDGSFPDSPLEGDGFELPVPREKGWSFDGSLIVGALQKSSRFHQNWVNSKLRGCDSVQLRIGDVFVRGRVGDRATVIQEKIGRPTSIGVGGRHQSECASQHGYISLGPIR